MRFARFFSLTAIFAAVAPLSDLMALPGDSAVVYTFDDLRVNCGWNVTTSGLYADLVFPSSAYMAPCNTPNGTVGLTPSREGVAGLLEVRVGLPAPASAVSLEAYMYASGETPTLVAYDADGVELTRASGGTLGSWVTIEVLAGDTPIQEIGLLMPQLRVHLDNITVTPAGTTTPEPEPEPEPTEPDPPVTEPTVPVIMNPTMRSDCMSRGWHDFGFKNQGQCMRFLETGKDSRPSAE